MDELVFVTNFSNNVDVISDELWNSACKTKPLNFSRVVVRTITVADKYTARG
jgi:hypothetical protein